MKGLVATGSKDSQIKLWDPRAGEAITTIYCHKHTVTKVRWSPDGQWLASGSKDQLVMLMDIRTMNVRKVFKAHQKEVTSLCWHPETNGLLASGGHDNAIHFWDTAAKGSDRHCLGDSGASAAAPIASLPAAHDGPVWSLSWHQLGHLLVSGSHDYSVRFWSRARPGDMSFTELLPKRVVSSIIEAPVQVVPTTTSSNILASGIFAGPSPKEVPPESCAGVGAGATAREQAAALAAAAAAKEAERLGIKAIADGAEKAVGMKGLSLGEGANKLGILDTADFDEVDGKTATPAAKSTGPMPVGLVKSAGVQPIKQAKAFQAAPKAADKQSVPVMVKKEDDVRAPVVVKKEEEDKADKPPTSAPAAKAVTPEAAAPKAPSTAVATPKPKAEPVPPKAAAAEPVSAEAEKPPVMPVKEEPAK
eukprot:gnl/TRDRNA2_/TRDRNA2_134173_c1_seq1.p1 gnl/TRDRNA2_/TRDRNA2_134173_c1~~gnl/TRDRNA2_/TRDRNA2_134173_c1_seq1.p1  ORF type:complete len:419 (+),score=94.20 gnl/TRDRNA2_/TRDRNA2_134173_c1_seq1:264-1520(+)